MLSDVLKDAPASQVRLILEFAARFAEDLTKGLMRVPMI